MKIWSCKIGEVDPNLVPPGADNPMRNAVAKAYEALTGQVPGFIFSGWGAEITEPERAVVESRLPSEQYMATRRAVKRIGDQFHQTRLSHNVSVDPDDLALVLRAAGYYDRDGK